MQPKDLSLRMALHDVFSSSMLVKIFLNKKNHGYLVIQDKSDILKIVEATSSICTLKQCEIMDVPDIQSRIVDIQLSTPLNLNDFNTTRNLLSSYSNPMKTLSDLDCRAQSLYPNSQVAKKGSCKSMINAHADTLCWLVEGVYPSYPIANPTINIPVVNTTHITVGEEIIAVLSILDSDQRLFVNDPQKDLKDEGGVVLWRVDPSKSVLKRQWKVVKSEEKVERREGIRFSYVGESFDSTAVGKGRLSPKQRWDLSSKVYAKLHEKRRVIEVNESHTIGERIACIQTLGDVDSSQSMFNKIVGIFSF